MDSELKQPSIFEKAAFYVSMAAFLGVVPVLSFTGPTSEELEARRKAEASENNVKTALVDRVLKAAKGRDGIMSKREGQGLLYSLGIDYKLNRGEEPDLCVKNGSITLAIKGYNPNIDHNTLPPLVHLEPDFLRTCLDYNLFTKK